MLYYKAVFTEIESNECAVADFILGAGFTKEQWRSANSADKYYAIIGG